MKYATLLIDFPTETIAHVKINRPEKLNALNPQFWPELKSCFETLSVNKDIRCIILSGGDSKIFTAGLDLVEAESIFSFDNADPARSALSFLPVIHEMQDAVSAIERCLKPVIVAVHGACIGAGLDIITAADIRLCTKDAFFTIKEVDIAITADVGVLQRLPKIVGNEGWVRECALTGRVFKSTEAFNQRLISKVFESKEEMMDAAISMAKSIAEKSPVAILGIKNHSVQDGLTYVATWNAGMLNTKDVTTAVTSYFQKKKPNFAKL